MLRSFKFKFFYSDFILILLLIIIKYIKDFSNFRSNPPFQPYFDSKPRMPVFGPL